MGSGQTYITGQTRQSPLNCLSSNGNIQQLADDNNSFFYSVSADLTPLDLSFSSVTEDASIEQFAIEPYQVERKLALLRTHKACGPDDVSNWFWRDFSVWLAEPLSAIFNVGPYLYAKVLFRQLGSLQRLSRCLKLIHLPP